MKNFSVDKKKVIIKKNKWLEVLLLPILKVAIILQPLLVLAEESSEDSLPLVATSPPETIVSEKGAEGLVMLINNASRLFYGIILVIGVAFILYSAFTIITSGGDEAKFKKGKAILKNTIIGVIVAVLSVSIVLVVVSLFE